MMGKCRFRVVFGVGLLAAVGGGLAASALAEKPIRDEFKAKYVKAESTAASDVALKAAFEKARCNVCHQGENKKKRNAYGQALAKLISHADVKDKAKIGAALEKVAAEKSNPDDPNSATYGDIIAEGKLPCAH